MFAVAMFGVGIGAFGPIYLHSADQSILNGILSNAPIGNTGITLEASGNGTRTAVFAAAADVPKPGGGKRWFGSSLSTEVAGLTSVVDDQEYGASLVSRTNVCAHLSIVSGSCVEHIGTVIMSTRSAHQLGLKMGQTLVTSLVGSRRTASFVIAGLYKPGNASASYWWGANLFAFGTGPPVKPELDAVFTSAATLRTAAPRSVTSYMLQLPYEPGSLAVDSLAGFQTSLALYQREAMERDGVLVTTQLPQLLSRVTTTEHTVTTIIAAIDLQMVLLAIYVLYFIASRTAAEREPDVRLAEIRGFRPRSTLAVAMTEPIAIVITAVPIGLLIAWLVALLSASAIFGSGISASVTVLAVVAAIVTGTVGIGATALGTRRMLATVVATSALDSGTAAQAYSSTWTLVAEVAGVVIAVAAFVELAVVGVSTTGVVHTDPLAAVAPGLLALALGILGARLLPPLIRVTFRFTSHSSKVAVALATRWVTRRREFAGQVILLSIAVGLTAFGVCGWAIAARNRTVQSEFDVGAAKVLTVSVRPGVNFLSAVREADPSGRGAMAVVVEHASDGTTLAVDSSRMNDVISWPPGLGAGVEQVKRRLVPTHLAPAVLISGTSVRVTVDADVDVQPRPQIALDLFDEGLQTPQQVALGNLRPGLSTYQGSVQGLCASGCRLVDLAITWAPSNTAVMPTRSVDLVIPSLSQRSATGNWEPLRAGLTDVHRWYSPSGGVRLESKERGLYARVDLDPDGGPVTIAPEDVPLELPAVVTSNSSPGPELVGGLSFAGLDGSTISGRAVGQVQALPRIGGDATLVDLDMAERFLSGPMMNDTTEVWLSGTAPASIASRLAAHGISIVSVDSATAREKAMAHDGVDLAYTLFLISAIAAAALAVSATAFAVATAARRREGEFAAMRAVGIGARSLRRSLGIEQGLTLGAGILCGAVAGVAAIGVALKSVPEFVALGPGPPLELGLPTLLLSVTLGALILALGLTVGFSAAVFVRRASADKLGGAQM